MRTDTVTRPRPGTAHPWLRTALSCGVLVALVQAGATAYVLAFFATTHPPMDATPGEAAQGFAAAASEVAIGTYLLVLQTPFWLVFLAGLVAVLRRADGDGVPPGAVHASGVALVVITGLGALVSAVVPTIGQLGGDGAVVKALDGLTPLALALSGFPRAVLLAAVAAVVLTRAIAPRWVAWTALGLAVVALAGTGTILDAALFPLASLGALLFAVWTAVLSVALLRREATR